MDTYAAECYDSVALFLCIHIIHRYKVIMHKRNAPVLDKSVTPMFIFFLCFTHLLQSSFIDNKFCTLYSVIVTTIIYVTAYEADAYMFYRCFFSVFCFFFSFRFFRPSQKYQTTVLGNC